MTAYFTGQPKRITSKIGSFTNANYKPGGGNVCFFKLANFLALLLNFIK